MPKSLNRQIREAAMAATDWWGWGRTKSAYQLFDAINSKLFEGALPDPLIRWDNTGRLQIREGHYWVDRDGSALYGVFDLRDDLNALETALGVCHNTAHLYLESYDGHVKKTINTNGWYHPVKFRDIMLKRFGIVVNNTGAPVRLTGEFWETLMGMGWASTSTAMEDAKSMEFDAPEVQIPDPVEESEEGDPLIELLEIGPKSVMVPVDTHPVTFQASSKPKAKSKMVKWTCGCEVGAIRAAVVLYSVCLKCQQPYQSEMTDVNSQWHNDYKTLQKLYAKTLMTFYEKGGAS